MISRFRQFICLLSCCFFLGTLNAQSGQIKGVIQDGDTPLGYATLLLKSASDSVMVKTALSTESGQFTFSETAYGSYFVEASYVGMSTYSSEIIVLDQSSLSISPIVMQMASNDLNAVEVVAKAPLIEVLADKTVFNVQNSLSATGVDGFELLRKAPGVIIDNTDNVVLEGKTGVQYYINGKLSQLAGEDMTNYLRSLQSSDIEAIEIITQPSARFDAAGNAGIINIRLKKDKRLGTNGTLTGGYAYGKNSRYNSSVSFNNRSKKTNLFGTYSNNFGDTWSFINLDRTQQGVRYDSQTETVRNSQANNVRVGFDVFPHAFHTFGVLVNGNFYNRNSEGLTTTPISPLSTGEVTQKLVARNESDSENYNLATNFNYRFADTLGHELLIDFDYGRYNRDRQSFQPNEYLDAGGEVQIFERNFRMFTPTDIDILTAKFDYSQDLFSFKLSTGAKYSNVSTNNQFEFFDVVDGNDVRNADRSNEFIYEETINAAYVNLQRQWKKWSAQFGLRVEQTISEGDLISTQSSDEDNVKRNYTNWFPSGGITYSPDYKNSWALTYSRRIQRPNYQSLNPFESQIDELTFSKGNPFLQPQYTHNVKLSHTYKYRLTTSLSYTHISDFFAQVTDTIGADKNFLITRNIANQEIVNVGVSYPFEVNKWWSVYASVNAYHASYKGSDEKFVAIDQTTLSFYGQNTFTLPKGFKLEVSGWFNSPSVWGGTYLTRSMGSLDIAVQKKFMDDKLSCRLAFSDVFFTSFWRADMQFGELYIDGSGGWESRQVRFNMSYRFGNNKVKNSRKRKTGLEEEGRRVGDE